MEARICEAEALARVGRWMWDVGSDAVQWSDELNRIIGVDPATLLERSTPTSMPRILTTAIVCALS